MPKSAENGFGAASRAVLVDRTHLETAPIRIFIVAHGGVEVSEIGITGDWCDEEVGVRRDLNALFRWIAGKNRRGGGRAYINNLLDAWQTAAEYVLRRCTIPADGNETHVLAFPSAVTEEVENGTPVSIEAGRPRRRMKVILTLALSGALGGFLISYVFTARYTSISTVLVEGQKFPTNTSIRSSLPILPSASRPQPGGCEPQQAPWDD